MKASLNIEVCFAQAERQVIVPVKVHSGATIADAIALAKILSKFPEINLQKNRVGIFGKLAKLDTLVREGDRVEIYRPLVADPKEARRKRAARTNK
jgi:uncharacterized protein